MSHLEAPQLEIPQNRIFSEGNGKFYSASIGCIESNLAGGLYHNFFYANNWIPVDDPKEADIVIVATCGVTKVKTDQSIEYIQKLEKTVKKDAYIVVAGCVPKIIGDELAKHVGAHTIITPSPQDVEKLITSQVPINKIHSNFVRYKYMRLRMKMVLVMRRVIHKLNKLHFPVPEYTLRVVDAYEDPRWYYIKIADGCMHNCAFCAIKLAKGDIRSRPMEPIIQELKDGIAMGQKNIVLSADDTGAYGQDIGSSFIELLQRMIEVEGDFKIYVRNLEPVWIIKHFEKYLEVLKSEKIRALTIPIQSGNSQVLKAMKRGHKIEPLVEKLKIINRELPHILLLSHFMVGLPGEDRKAFRDSLKVLRQVRFEGIAPDRFYAHPMTPSAKMEGQNGPITKWWRNIELIATIIWTVYFNNGKFWGIR